MERSSKPTITHANGSKEQWLLKSRPPQSRSCFSASQLFDSNSTKIWDDFKRQAGNKDLTSEYFKWKQLPGIIRIPI